MVKLGLVIGSAIFSPRASPRTKVVLPTPTSPISSITIFSFLSRDISLFPKSSARFSKSCSESIFIV